MKSLLDRDQNILFLVSSAHWRIQALLNEQFKKKGFKVTPEQWQIMLHIQMEGPKYQQELANMQNKDKSAVKRLVDHLEFGELVKRKRSKKDLRKKKIILTKKGDKLTKKLNVIAENTFQQACNDLTEVEYNALKRMLFRLKGK